MICKNCGKTNSYDSQYCIYCGANIKSSDSNLNIKNTSIYNDNEINENKRRNRNKIIISILIPFLIISILIISIMYCSNRDKEIDEIIDYVNKVIALEELYTYKIENAVYYEDTISIISDAIYQLNQLKVPDECNKIHNIEIQRWQVVMNIVTESSIETESFKLGYLFNEMDRLDNEIMNEQIRISNKYNIEFKE